MLSAQTSLGQMFQYFLILLQTLNLTRMIHFQNLTLILILN
jgi:hypothetical protein